MALIVYYMLPIFVLVKTFSAMVEIPPMTPPDLPEYDAENVTDISGTSTRNTSKCVKEVLHTDDVQFLEKAEMFHKAYNITLKSSRLKAIVSGRHICFEPTDDLKKEILSKCEKWLYEESEYEKLPNGSVFLGDEILEPLTYDFVENGKLRMCVVEDYDYDVNTGDIIYPRPLDDIDVASMYIGNIGSAISILALIAHIVIFCKVPSLRNLPGYNLLSFSVAFLMAYSFTLFGQIPQVLGYLCVASGVLEYYFFLVAFFCMNVMAFEVWKTLRMAVEKLAVRTKTAKKRQFLWYSLYAWLCPLAFIVAALFAEYSKSFPDRFRPLFGRGNECWMTNNTGKAVFFVIPAFILFGINAIFFVMTAYILKKHTLKPAEEEHRQKVRMNFVLYVRLALMMGLTWLVGVIAVLVDHEVTWYIADILNSLQGLFVFILFTCSRKVVTYIKDKMSMTNMKTESDKSITNTTKLDSK